MTINEHANESFYQCWANQDFSRVQARAKPKIPEPQAESLSLPNSA